MHSRKGALLIAAALTAILFSPPIWMIYHKAYEKEGALIIVVLTVCLGFSGLIYSFYKKWGTDIPWAVFLVFILIWQFAFLYQQFGGVRSANVDVTDFYSLLYFSVITWTTLGYGDLTPSGPARTIAASEAITGYFVSALLVALIVDRISKR